MRVVMTGTTGLVGSLIADRLLTDDRFAEIHAVGRRASGRLHPRWREHVSPVERWPGIVEDVAADKAVSALGTTWRAAGSEKAFRAVDIDMVVGFAAAARRAGARHMLAISATGADAASRNFYLRVKGEAERGMAALGFERLDLLRPGLLRGERGSERRLGERVAILLSPVTDFVMRGPLDRYAAIDGACVAEAAVACLHQDGTGTRRLRNREMLRMVGK